jgi:hypothetical protein
MSHAPVHLCITCVKRGTYDCPSPASAGIVVETCKDFAGWSTGRHTPTPSGGLLQMQAASETKFMSEEERQKQVGGSHYKDRAIQPWDIILEYKLDFWEGNALKYLLRRKNNRLEDLKKARHYLDECVRQLEAK